MSRTRARRGRAAFAGFGLALAATLIWAGEARAAKYAVAQCGWHVASEAAWADTTGGAKFRPSSYCAAPAAADPFDGVHLKSFTREGQQTVSGTRFARWRWTTPPGTGIVNVRGTWWHALHDGFEHRLGTDSGDGGFAPFAWAAATDVVMRDFAAGFWPPQWAFEDRLLCARAESRSCSLDASSWSGLRALTITIQDDGSPAGTIGGNVTSTDWQRGIRFLDVWGSDVGGGVRFGESFIDGARVAVTEYPCAKAMIGGEWRATRMLPCQTAVAASQAITTTGLSDGPHGFVHCLTDFAGNSSCFGHRTIHVDNNAPAHPRSVGVAGGEGWRRVNDFDIGWVNPSQAPASPIWGAFWRITGRGGYDTGVNLAPGRDVNRILDRTLPGAGAYSLQLWLRDEAGNEAPSTAVEVPLRLDDVPPGVGFDAGAGSGFPDAVRADVFDEHAGPATGEIRLRRLGADAWTELPTRLERGASPDRAQLVARLPESLAPGTYLFRAEALDGAGNAGSTTRRADGTEMALRKPPPPSPPPAPGGAGPDGSGHRRASRGKTRIFARLRRGKRSGTAVTVAYGTAATLAGRLVDADGAGLAERRIRVVARPSRGALLRPWRSAVETGRHGRFSLTLPAGPSRRIAVVFPGDGSHERSLRAPLSLRVRSRVVLRAAPLELRTGQAIRLWGSVRTRGAPLPRRGKLLAIQYLEAATGRWRPVLVTRSDHDGRFRARYRFRYVIGTARIRLRAVALAEERWPYVAGASRPVTVRVSG